MESPIWTLCVTHKNSHGTMNIEFVITQSGARSYPPLHLHHPHHRRRLLHPRRTPLPLGNRSHCRRLHQACSLWRQHHHPQHLRRVSCLRHPSVNIVKFFFSLVWVLSAFTLGGLYYFAYTDVGIVNALKMLWRL